MKNFKKSVLLLLLSINYFANSQSVEVGKNVLPTIFSASPNAASLGTYGQIPVNLFNGLPNININLYNLKVDNYELPISLSYNLAAIKPEERPGWTGLGWNLNAGGAITRIVKGGVDEVLGKTLSSTDDKLLSYYYNFRELDNQDWDSPSNLAVYASWLKSNNSTKIAAFPAPDEFIFNVNGLSGSFYKNHEGKWIVKSNQKIDIKITEEIKPIFRFFEIGDHATHSKRRDLKGIFYGFTLVTDDGTQYVFGKNPNAIEFSAAAAISNATDYYPNFVAKTWYLTKIILPSSKSISFEYKTNVLPGTYAGQGETYNTAVWKRHIVSNYMKYWTNGSISQGSSTPNLENVVVERTFVVYPDKIITDDAEITFNNSFSNDLDYPFGVSASEWEKLYLNEYPKGLDDYLRRYGQHWYKLDNLVIKDKISGKQVYKTNFKYLENPTSRLFLTSIEESGSKYTTSVKKHSFEYNSTALPAYNSLKIDHWGYFNNTNFRESYPIPNNVSYSVADLRDNYYATRNPNAAAMQAGTLSKINYPTGGYSVFYYEPHDFSKVVDRTPTGFILLDALNANEIAGGLRIKKIESDPLNNGAKLIKEYFYNKDYANNDFSSSGILSGRPQYIEESSIPSMQYFKLSTNSFSQLNNTSGSHVTYTNVVEKSQDGSFTEYVYSNHDNGFIDKSADGYLFDFTDFNGNSLGMPAASLQKSISHKISFNSLQSERGNLLSQKKKNNSKQLVEETNYTYNNDINRFNDKIRLLDFSQTQIGEVTTGSTGIINFFDHVKIFLKLAAYTEYSHQVYLKKKVNTIYDLKNNSSTTNTIDYEYSNTENHHHIKSELSINSEGITEEKKYFYAPDNEMTTEPFRADLIIKNITGVPLSIKTFSGTAPQVKVSEQLTRFGSFPSQTSSQLLFLPKEVFNNKGTSVISARDRKITYDKYDTSGNLLQYTLENNLPVSIIWGYNNTLPVAKLENVVYSGITPSIIDNIQKESNAGRENTLKTSLDNLRSSSPFGMITTYTYKPLIGINSITDPKGISTFYNYDEFNRLSFVRDQNLNVLERYCYNYKNQLINCDNTIYFNALKEASFNGNCGGTVFPVIYTIESGTYTSTLSQADADNKAQLDLTENGPNYANKNVPCIYSNDLVTGNFLRKNCDFGTDGALYISYTVPAGTYTSHISKQDAQAKAQADFDANGQNYANANGICSPISFTVNPIKEYSLNKIFLDLYASSNNHNGHNYAIEINYYRDNGDFVRTETANLSLLAGETYKRFTIPAPISSTAEINY